jgi:hypothetical protein
MSSDIQDSDFTEDEILARKQSYLDSKQALVSMLRELIDILETSEDVVFSGKNRTTFMNKFAAIDHTLLGKFDFASFSYFETQNNEKSGL